MDNLRPVAIINGDSRPGSRQLVEKLVENDIEIIECGEFGKQIEEVEEKADYIFDFCGDEKAWMKAEKDGSRLTLITINLPSKSFIYSKNVNWREVSIRGVLARNLSEEEKREVIFLIEAMRLAVDNKNLILPSRMKKFRIMVEKDVAEVVMRMMFLPGMEEKRMEVWGRLVNTEELAQILIDEAKMTRHKVEEDNNIIPASLKSNIADDEVEKIWRQLRWQPGENLSQGIKEMLQEMFAKKDEEKRQIKSTLPIKKVEINREEVPKYYEVEITKVEEVKPKIVEIKNEVVEQQTEIAEERMEVENIKPFLEKKHVEEPEINKKEEKKEEGVKVEEYLEVEKTKEKSGNWRKILINMGIVWGLLVLMGGLLFVGSNWLMIRKITAVEELIKSRQFDRAAKELLTIKKWSEKSESNLDFWGGKRWIWGRRYDEILKLTDEGVLLGESVLKINSSMESINKAVFDDKEIDWTREVDKLKVEIDNTETYMGMILARMSGDWSWVPYRWRGKLTEIKGTLTEMKYLMGKSGVIVNSLPELLGVDGKRREYLVLLQNESELRAGGGFIGSFGILSFERGRLLSFEIKDVYEADGQLKGHVEPPEEIKKYLGEANWYLRDANWQPDFKGVSRDAQWFLEKETGRKVDGVIGINLATAKGILEAIGEVYVPDFKEKINKNNLYEQAEFYSETKFFPGSNQKASFLGGLGKQLFEEIKNTKVEKRWRLAETMINLLEENEIQITINDKEVGKLFDEAGWSGSIFQLKCPLEKGDKSLCLTDYVYVVESNFGVNKANYFLYRNIDLAVDISQRSLSRILKINYENTAKSTAWPGGEYKNYLRIYIPERSGVAEVSITDPQTGGKTILTGDNLKISTVSGKKELGFLMTVPISKKRVVEVRYSDQIDLTKAEKLNYLGYIQKQSGYGDTGMVVLMSPPIDWIVNFAEPNGSVVNGKLLFNQKLNKDLKMSVEFGK